MRKQAYTMIATMILAGFVAMSSARAQSISSGKLVANIPFEFNVGNKAMPAGEYTVRQVNPASDHAVLQLRSKDGSASAMVQMTSLIATAQETAKLVFHCYGDRYFFAQAWTAGTSNGLEAPRPRAERAMSERLAGNAPKTETIALTARR